MVDRAIRREGSLRQERRPVPLDFVSVMAYRWRRELKSLALFGKTDQHRRIRPTHAALQLSCGNWTSKLGEWPDRALAPRKKLKTIPLMETLRFHDKRPSPFTARP